MLKSGLRLALGRWAFMGEKGKLSEGGFLFVTCRIIAGKGAPISFPSRRLENVTPVEIAQMCSVFGSVGRVAMQCRLDVADQASSLHRHDETRRWSPSA